MYQNQPKSAKIGENRKTNQKTIKINQKWTNLYQVNPNLLEYTKMDSNWVKIEENEPKKCMKLPGLAAAVVAEAPSAIDNYCSSFFFFY